MSMKLHPQNPTPGVNELPPAKPLEPVTNREILNLIGEILSLVPSNGNPVVMKSKMKAWDSLNALKDRL
jgi:hypothetical protein